MRVLSDLWVLLLQRFWRWRDVEGIDVGMGPEGSYSYSRAKIYSFKANVAVSWLIEEVEVHAWRWWRGRIWIRRWRQKGEWSHCHTKFGQFPRSRRRSVVLRFLILTSGRTGPLLPTPKNGSFLSSRYVFFISVYLSLHVFPAVSQATFRYFW